MPTAFVELKSWDDIHPHLKRGWLYRGQEREDWELKTSLERLCKREKLQPLYMERELLRDFKRMCHNYSHHVPGAESDAEWIALMQHHGAPTRLLDFTYSIYVAAYFAMDSAAGDSAVWAVNAPWAFGRSLDAFTAAKKDFPASFRSGTINDHERVFRNLLLDEPFAKAAVPLSPFLLNERLRAQRGTFLAPGDISVSFMENLRALDGHADADHLLKIIIPNRLRDEGIEKLFYMNISRTSLFPGLDGYAQSLGVFHPSFRPDPYLTAVTPTAGASPP